MISRKSIYVEQLFREEAEFPLLITSREGTTPTLVTEAAAAATDVFDP